MKNNLKITSLSIILFAIFLVNSVNVYSQTWSSLGSGMNSEVEGLLVYNNELVAGGQFTIAGGDSAKYIAKWNGSSWFPIGSGVNGTVHALTVFNNELIAAGAFTNAGGIPANRIAKWNGTSWLPLGNGLTIGYQNTEVFALTVFNNELIAGGNFSMAGDSGAYNIAKWNGSYWSPLGSGTEWDFYKFVLALQVYNNELIVGGRFNTAGGISAINIAKWNGISWSAIGNVVGNSSNHRVSSLCIFNNELIIGGIFTTAGGISATGIARWNGTTWATLGSGLGGIVPIAMAYTVFNSELIVGGQFTMAGGNNASSIAKWNGTNWSQLGSGMGGASYPNVRALSVYNNHVIAGGVFITAGGITVNRIAKWGAVTGINNNSETAKEYSLSQNYPNPFNPSTTIRFSIPPLTPKGEQDKGNLVRLDIYNSLGQIVGTPVNEKPETGEYEITWNAGSLPSGVYYYKLISGDYSETKKMLLIK